MNSEVLVKRTTKIMYGDEGVSGTAQYISQLVWILFLKVFDYKEEEWELEDNYVSVIPAPFRFRDWADPKNMDGSRDYKNRLTGEKLIDFVNIKLFPFLRGNEVEIDGKKYIFTSDDPKAFIVREFMSESSNYMKDGVNLRQVVNEIAEIDFDNVGEKHEFNDFYEKLLKELQNGGKATGEFYTPRAVTKFITDHVDPKIGERVADFACGTAGFLAEAVSHMQKQAVTIEDNDTIQKSVMGIEWKQLPYMLATTNMFLHNVDNPNIVHGDGLAKNVLDLSDDDMFDCILMNPPFGGIVKESDKGNFPNELVSSESADLFVARILFCLKKNGRCGLVLPDGLLFDTANSKVALKRKLLTECNLHTVIRLPNTVFAPYTDITTNLLFFDKTGKTQEVWFYRMDMPDGKKRFNKTHPIRREDLEVVDEWWDNRVEIKDEKEDETMTDTWKSRKYTFAELEERDFDLNLCGYPEKEEIILSPEETIGNYISQKQALEHQLSVATGNLEKYLTGDETVSLFNIKSISEKILKLDSSFASDMKKSILQSAIVGGLTERLDTDTDVEVILKSISEKKQSLIKEKKIKKDIAVLDLLDGEELPDIPENWRWVNMQDIFNIRSAIRIHQSDWKNSGVPFFRGRELVQLANTGEVTPEIYISQELYEENKKKGGVPQKDDILVSAVGTIGKVYIVKGTKEFYYKDAYILCFENIGNLHPLYFKYLLESPFLQKQIFKDSMATTVAQLTIEKAKSLVIPFPPIEEQRRIAERLTVILPLLDN